ncbi:MAG: hypothetical protein HQ534_11330 [Armatimonadetes bacterium]|nr:hypothetical protein [Armatimonadota bacterium]
MEDKMEGNKPLNEVERIEEIAGEKVKVYYDKEDTEYKTPIRAIEPELEGDKLEKWREDKDNIVKMKKSASDGYDKNAIERKNLESERTEFEEQKRKFGETQKEFEKRSVVPIKVEAPDFNKILAEKSGESVNTNDDVLDIQSDNPSAYHEAMLEYNRKSGENLASTFKEYRDTDSMTKMETALFKQKVETQGINFEQLKSYAKPRGYPLNDFTLKSFKLENNKSNITNDINNSIPKDIEFSWIPAGDVKTDPTAKTLTEEYPSQQELDNYMLKERRKTLDKQDPRIVALFK